MLARHGGLAQTLRSAAALALAAEVLAPRLSLEAAATSTAVATGGAAGALIPSAALGPRNTRTILASVLALPISLAGNNRSLLQPGRGFRGRWALRLLLLQLWRLRRGHLEVRDGPRNRLGILVHVQALVNGVGNRLDLGAQVALDIVQVEAIVPVDQVDGQAEVAIPARATNTVKVRLGVLGEIEVDDDVHGLDINTTGEKIRADEVTADTVAEVVEDAVTGLLSHLGVAVEAGVPELGDLLGEQLDAVRGVAEDDGLVDLQFGEERVETVDLLLLLDIGIVLRDAAEGQFVHEIDLVRADHVLVREILDRKRESGGEEHDLAVLGMEAQELLDNRGELDGEKLVGLVHDEHGAFAQVGHLLASQIEDSAGGSDHNMDGILQPDDIVTEASATSGNHNVDAEVLAERLADLRCLHGQLASGDEDETLDLGDLGVDLFQCGDDEGGGLAGAVLGTSEDVTARKGYRYALFLNRGGLFEAGLKDAHEQVPLQAELLELQALGVGHILHAYNVSDF